MTTEELTAEERAAIERARAESAERAFLTRRQPGKSVAPYVQRIVSAESRLAEATALLERIEADVEGCERGEGLSQGGSLYCVRRIRDLLRAHKAGGS